MAEKVIAASLQLDDKQAEASVKNFRTQLREAQQSLLQMQDQFGPTSQQALTAARSVAELRDRMDEAREVTELYDPGKKFVALSNVLRTAAGGMTAITGALALMGIEGKETEKTLLKVQSALAVTEGLNTIFDSVKDFRALKVAATEAFNAIKVGIGSTGIGALVLALGLLVTYWDDIKESVTGVTKAERENLDTATKLAEKEKEKVTHMEEQDNLYKLHGASEREILKIKEKILADAIAASENELNREKIIQDIQVATAKRNKEILVGLINLTALPLKALTGSIDAIAEKFGRHLNLTKYVDDGIDSVAKLVFDPESVRQEADKTNAETQAGIDRLRNQLAGFKLQERELNKKAAAEARDFQKELTSIKNDGDYARITDSTELAKRQLADQYRAQQEEINASERTQKQKSMLLFAADETYRAKVAKVDMDEKKAAADREKAGLDMLAKLREEAHQTELKSKKDQEDAKVNAEADARLKEIEALKITEQLKTQLIAEAEAARKGKLAQNAADDELSQIDRLVKASENEKLSMAARLTALDEYMARVKESTFLTEQDKTTFEASAAETRKAISQSEYEHKKAMAEATANVLGAAANMFAKQTAAYKVLAIAQATINTFVGVSDALQAKSFTVFDTVLKFTNAAMILAAGIANVRKIVAVQVPNATVSAPSMPSISAPAPLSTRPQMATTQLPQEQINQIGNATVRAFVVESDMTNSQERIARLNRAARLGG